MLEFNHNGVDYRGVKIDTFTQMNILSRVGPVVGPMFQSIGVLPDGSSDEAVAARNIGQVNAFLEALRKMSDEEREFVAKHCLGSLQRKQHVNNSDVWAPVYRNNRFMFDDIDNLSDLLALTARVLGEVLGGFLSIKASGQDGLAALQRPTLVSNG
jgi:hypothetical protein